GIVTPVWLFPSIGVARSSYMVCALLAGIAIALAIGQFRPIKLVLLGVGVIAVTLATMALASTGDALYSFDSAYQSIRIVEEKAENGRAMRVLLMGGSRSSAIYAESGETAFEYVLAAEQALAEVNPDCVLVVGAAGFTFPRD